jgi:hypothetical protein
MRLKRTFCASAVVVGWRLVATAQAPSPAQKQQKSAMASGIDGRGID